MVALRRMTSRRPLLLPERRRHLRLCLPLQRQSRSHLPGRSPVPRRLRLRRLPQSPSRRRPLDPNRPPCHLPGRNHRRLPLARSLCRPPVLSRRLCRLLAPNRPPCRLPGRSRLQRHPLVQSRRRLLALSRRPPPPPSLRPPPALPAPQLSRHLPPAIPAPPPDNLSPRRPLPPPDNLSPRPPPTLPHRPTAEAPPLPKRRRPRLPRRATASERGATICT